MARVPVSDLVCEITAWAGNRTMTGLHEGQIQSPRNAAQDCSLSPAEARSDLSWTSWLAAFWPCWRPAGCWWWVRGGPTPHRGPLGGLVLGAWWPAALRRAARQPPEEMAVLAVPCAPTVIPVPGPRRVGRDAPGRGRPWSCAPPIYAGHAEAIDRSPGTILGNAVISIVIVLLPVRPRPRVLLVRSAARAPVCWRWFGAAGPSDDPPALPFFGIRDTVARRPVVVRGSSGSP